MPYNWNHLQLIKVDENVSNIVFIEGANFSGRSDYLKELCSINPYPLNKGIYVGEIPGNYLSGVSPTVKEELELFSQNTKMDVKDAVHRLLDQFGFEKLSSNNPFTLSGGEQVVLSIIIGLLLEPSFLAIDTATEQLNKEWAEPLFKLMQNNLSASSFYISDNRMDEYDNQYSTITPAAAVKDYKNKFLKPIMQRIQLECNPKEVVLNDIVFGYQRNVTVLKGIDLTLSPGNLYFLKGVNGAGKSTLAKILSGILKPQMGTITVNNEKSNLFKYPGKVFGYSFQNPDEQLFSRSVAEEVYRFDRKETKEMANRRELYLEMFGLKEIRHCHPAEMPFVMRKRIAIAATLATDRPWYILDEPSVGQDSEFLDFLKALFDQLTKQGKGLIIISHSQNFISKFDANIIYLDKGKLNLS